MKTQEEYMKIFIETSYQIEKRFPNWNMLNNTQAIYSLFAKCLPDGLSYEDVVSVCALFFCIPNKK